MNQDNLPPTTSQDDTKFIFKEKDDEDGDCKIHISNIPGNLKSVGLKKLLQEFGTIEEIYFPAGNKWAFVTFSNKAECEVAIMRIQGMFGLKVDFAKKKEKQEVDDLLENLPILPTEPKEVNIDEMIEPFHLPTFQYEFPKLLITEDDYQCGGGMLRFDPKKEFLFAHDMFWADKYTRPSHEKKVTRMHNFPEILEKIFPETPSGEIKPYPLLDCDNCRVRKSLITCRDCQRVYCSSQCQKEDELDHMELCKKNGKKDNEKENRPKKVGDLEEPVSFPARKSLVCVTAMYNPREMFVRSMTPTNNAKYVKMINHIHYFAMTAEFLKKPPQLYTMVLAKYKKFYTRAFVVHHDDLMDLTSVILYDVGGIEKIPWMELKVLSEELALLPRLIFRCNLIGGNVLEYNISTLSYTVNLNLVTWKIDYDDLSEVQIPEVRLFNNEVKEKNLQEHLKCLVKRPLEQVDHSVYKTMNHLDETETTPNRNVEIIVLSNAMLKNGQIACAIYTQYIQFLHQWELMQEHCVNLGEKFVPVRDHMCLVNLVEDGKWHRAMCIESSQYRILKLLLLDVGVFGSIRTENSRKLPTAFDFPTPLKMCKLEGLPDILTEEKVSELQQLLPQNKRILAKELKEDDDFIRLTFYDI
ncbi:hypothetical protein DMENIID0001_060290 [Sergentomyia squamirostris]